MDVETKTERKLWFVLQVCRSRSPLKINRKGTGVIKTLRLLLNECKAAQTPSKTVMKIRTLDTEFNGALKDVVGQDRYVRSSFLQEAFKVD